MRTIQLLGILIMHGCSNEQIQVIPNDMQISFKDFLGSHSANGSYSIDDFVPSGVFVFGENTIKDIDSIPDAIFYSYEYDTKIAFFKYIA
jgi:hypothetical protein